MDSKSEDDNNSNSHNPGIFVIDRKCSHESSSERGMRVNSFDKYLIAVIIGIVFLILSLPILYKLTNKLTGIAGLRTVSDVGKPTALGLILHTVVFIIIVRLLMH